MSFINKSVQFSQTDLLKTTIVRQLLTSYNKFFLSKTNSCIGNVPFIIPNNSKKFYLFVTHNNRIDKTENYNLLYFFPDKETTKTLQVNKLEKNISTEFFMEIDLVFKSEYLLEGYLYTANNSSNISNYSFLITDILAINNEIVDCDYSLRYAIINEHFLSKVQNLSRLNDHLSISIHPIFEESNTSIIKIFMNNFRFSSQVNSFEIVNNFKKIRKPIENTISIDDKLITKTSQIDVYNVTDIKTNNNQGILYINSIKTSKIMKNLIQVNDNQYCKIKCKFNPQFNKWQPLLEN